MSAPPIRSQRPQVFALPGSPGVGALLGAWRHRPGLAALDSAGGAPARWSLVAFDPDRRAPAPRDLAGVRALARAVAPPDAPLPGPFHGGFLGALAYDLGVAGEGLALPADPWDTPPVAGGLYTDFVAIDHARGEAWLVLDAAADDGRPPVERRRAELEAELAGAPEERDAAAGVAGAGGVGPLVRHVPADAYRGRVERVRELIAAGEVYQVNLAHRFTRRTRGHPVDLYRRLRAIHPAPYQGYLAWGGAPELPGGALLSASPELLLECVGREARTRPIKGTAGRGATPEEDDEQRRMLLASAKDRAELAMIVDLERNDLARVAVPGSVRVEGLPSLESYASVHHLVADVRATLSPGLDGGDALAALFPGGSITGAPKLRSMEILAELEGEGRGFFSGSLGFLDARGHAAFDILIRTLVWRPAAGGEVGFHVGGGITWASDAAAEERETLQKGAALAAALCGEGEPRETLGAVVTSPGPG